MVCTLDIVVLSSYSHYAATVFRIPAAFCGLPQARPVAYDLMGQRRTLRNGTGSWTTSRSTASAPPPSVQRDVPHLGCSHYYPRTRLCPRYLPLSSTRNATGYNRTLRAGTWSWATSRSSPTAPPPAVQRDVPHLGYSHYYHQPHRWLRYLPLSSTRDTTGYNRTLRWYLALDNFTLHGNSTAAAVQ